MGILMHNFMQRASVQLVQQAACPSIRPKVPKSRHPEKPQIASQVQCGAATRIEKGQQRNGIF